MYDDITILKYSSFIIFIFLRGKMYFVLVFTVPKYTVLSENDACTCSCYLLIFERNDKSIVVASVSNTITHGQQKCIIFNSQVRARHVPTTVKCVIIITYGNTTC